MIANAATRPIADVPAAPGAEADSPGADVPNAAREATPTLWQWTPASGEFRVTKPEHDTLLAGTLADFLAQISTADQERVAEALSEIAHTSQNHLDVSYSTRDGDGTRRRARLVGHVADRNTAGMAVSVFGVTLAVDPGADNAKSWAGHALDLGLAFEGPHQGVWEWSASDNRFEASAQWRDLFGYSEYDIR